MKVVLVETEEALLRLAAEMVSQWKAGDVVLLEGPLGAGKTTFVRGLVSALGHVGPVRSPTFNLIQTFETDPPVMHADLYRLKSSQGVGLEDYMDDHLSLIEWPDRLQGILDFETCWVIQIEFAEVGRTISIFPPDK